MKKILVVATVVAVSLSSCGGGGGRIQSDLDSVAYAIGVSFGHQIKDVDSTINPNIVAKGLIDVFKNRAKMTMDSSIQVQREYFTVKLPAKKQKQEVAYLESVEKGNPNVVKTESGLIYEVIMPGDESVKATSDKDTVLVKYVGRFREALTYDAKKEGNVFDENENFKTALNRVVKGWTEGLQHVGKGGKIRLWIPSELGYGAQGNQMYGGPMGPYETLFFEVEVIDVIPAATAETETVEAQ